MAKIHTILSGCSTRRKPVGFQFMENGDKLYLAGSFIIAGELTAGKDSTVNGDFRIGQGFERYGCKLCGNKFVYQCGHCNGFVCYDGKAKTDAECPQCKKKSNVPTAKDDRIVRSSITRKIKIIMAMDTSSSMKGSPLEETKRAAISEFVTKFPDAEFALVSFESRIKTVCDFTKSQFTIKRCINGLEAGGGTNSPLHHILSNFSTFCKEAKTVDSYLIILTDGSWSGVYDYHYRHAEKLKNFGVKIITIGCYGADRSFLRKIASPNANIEVSGNDIGGAYASAAKKISQ